MFIADDVGTTRRGRLSKRDVLAAWEKHRGVCVICHQKIDGARADWILEHVRALELGGADTLDNLGPAHLECARDKTRDDHHRAAKAKRQKARNLGIHIRRSVMPGSRASKWGRRMNGTTYRRDDPAEA